MNAQAIMTPGGIADQLTNGLSGVAMSFQRAREMKAKQEQDALENNRADAYMRIAQQNAQTGVTNGIADRMRTARLDEIAKEQAAYNREQSNFERKVKEKELIAYQSEQALKNGAYFGEMPKHLGVDPMPADPHRVQHKQFNENQQAKRDTADGGDSDLGERRFDLSQDRFDYSKKAQMAKAAASELTVLNNGGFPNPKDLPRINVLKGILSAFTNGQPASGQSVSGPPKSALQRMFDGETGPASSQPDAAIAPPSVEPSMFFRPEFR